MKAKHALVAAGICLSAHSVGASANGGMQDFLDTLRNFESGINPALADFYLQNLDNAVYTYAQVTEPGHIVRDCATGSMIPEPTTINQFFAKLGIDDIYNSATPYDADMYKAMQYNSTNAWGFVGYQLGEALLIDSGYYSPKTVTVDGTEYDSFYIFLDDSAWIGCETEALAEIPGSGGNYVLSTDINRWEGTFVGKNGINTFEDLKIPAKQELVIRDAMRFNYNVMSQLLEDANMTWGQALAKSWAGTDENGDPVQVQATMSGLLAAAHLRGAWGAGALLTNDSITCDELGTCITTYVHKFGGFNTLFDTPADETIQGSSYDETLSAGWGNDSVITGGGSDVILLNEQAGSTTTLTDFTVGDDRIILRDWVAQSPLSGLVVSDTSEGAQLQFSGQTIVINNTTAAQVNADVSAVIVNSDVYTIAWSGTQVASGFDPSVDKIRGSAGIGFKHLKAYESNGSLFVGVQAADGGIYSYIELPGLTLGDLHGGMFDNVTGSFDRLGYIVSLGWQTWGWNMVVTVNSFDASKTEISLGAFSYSFSDLMFTQEGDDTIISLTPAAAGGDNKQVVLVDTQVTDLTADNFTGVSGSFGDATIDVPVFYDITVSVSGTGGSISPAPDSNNVISARGNRDFTLTFVPDSGYRVASVTVDGVAQAVEDSYTFTSLASAHTVVVTFEEGDTCPAAWVLGTVYVTDDTASYQGTIYRAKWWTNNNVPTDGDPWEAIGACE
ncbi:carbohydrate-binding protein [Microbulbifer aggregans]|uniref:carbohydrate-binding protein n=1 Tax=Microbulbifer aggregans TaxID=1769779 RepID=UPI001CFE6CF3|nr:carbohydrate-binding protein [Microbulbifer aggregans]